MKQSKILLGGLVGLLSLGIISTTIALYVSNPGEQVIQIGGSSGENGTFKLTKNAASSGDDFALNPNEPYVVQYDLGMTDLVNYTQDIVVGKLSISIDDTNNLWQYMDVTASVVGYTETSYFNDTTVTLENNETQTSTYAGEIELPFSINDATYGTQSIRIEFKLKDNVTDDTYLSSIAEKTLDYSINLSDATDYKYAYVRGSFDDCNWQTLDKYRMVPNIKAENEEWMYCGLELTVGDTLKCWIDEDGFEKWSFNTPNINHGDLQNNGNVYVDGDIAGENDLYWNGNDKTAVSFLHDKK